MEAAARLILILAVFGLALSWINYGPGGPLRWVRAKFLGRVA